MKWRPTPISLPGKSHGQGSLVSYSPQSQRIKHCSVTKQQQQQTHISVKRRFTSRHLRGYHNRNKVLDNGQNSLYHILGKAPIRGQYFGGTMSYCSYMKDGKWSQTTIMSFLGFQQWTSLNSVVAIAVNELLITYSNSGIKHFLY